MAITSSTGLASNIDTKAIVDALINADRAPARLAEKSKSVAQTRLDATKAMNTRLLALRDAMDAIEQKTAFASKKATSSNEGVMTATVGESAIAGSLTLNVKKLASASQIALAGQTTSDTDLGTGTVLLSIGSGAEVEITPTTNTLTGIASAINSANAGVSASVINDGSGTPYRLVVTSTKSGAANAISSFRFSGYGGQLKGTDVALVDGGATTVTAGADAEVRIGDPDTGLLLKSASNLMDQAIPGLALNLLATGDGVNVTVSQDADGVRSTVQALADTFNDARSYLLANSTFDVATLKSGALFNDYDLRNKLDSTERALTQTIAGQPTGFQKLADVGVTIDSTGKMVIDAAVFEAKLSENQDAVASLFLAAGVAGSAPMEQLTRSVDGSMALKLSNLEDNIASYTARITAVDARLEVRRKYYESKFLAMEKTIAALQAQGNALASFTDGLTSSKSK